MEDKEKEIETFVYQYFKGVKRIANDWRVICVFHKDSDPSLSIDRKSGYYHCFSCTASGGFSEIKEKFGEAAFEERRINSVDSETWDKMLDEPETGESVNIRKFGLPYGFKFLRNQDFKLIYHKYLKRRNIMNRAILHFKIGYVPRNLKGAKYHGRIIMPITDAEGNYIQPEARMAKEEWVDKRNPKYIRPMKSQVKKLLFNYFEAKKKKQVILVEGLIDAITLWQWKFNSVASMNPQLSKEQFSMLSSFERIYICYDGDEAGLKGLKRAKDFLIGKGIELFIISMPKGVDANNCTFREFNGYFQSAKRVKLKKI